MSRTGLGRLLQSILQHNNGYEKSNLMHIALPKSQQYISVIDKDQKRKSLTPNSKKKRHRKDEETADYAAGCF